MATRSEFRAADNNAGDVEAGWVAAAALNWMDLDDRHARFNWTLLESLAPWVPKQEAADFKQSHRANAADFRVTCRSIPRTVSCPMPDCPGPPV